MTAWAIRLIMAASVATVTVEIVFLILAGIEGKLQKVEPAELVAIAYGVDEQSLAEYWNKLSPPRTFSPIDIDEQGAEKNAALLNVDMRERSLQAARSDLSYYQNKLLAESKRYEQLRLNFENTLSRLESDANDERLVLLRETLANLDAAQAREQIVTMLQAAEASGDQEIENDIVVMIKSMPIDKRKKIIAEFQSEQDKQRLNAIFRQIRLGIPEVPLIERAREQLREFDPADTTEAL